MQPMMTLAQPNSFVQVQEALSNPVTASERVLAKADAVDKRATDIMTLGGAGVVRRGLRDWRAERTAGHGLRVAGGALWCALSAPAALAQLLSAQIAARASTKSRTTNGVYAERFAKAVVQHVAALDWGNDPAGIAVERERIVDTETLLQGTPSRVRCDANVRHALEVWHGQVQERALAVAEACVTATRVSAAAG